MKYFHAIVLSVLVVSLATPAVAQKDANTSSARAAYAVPSVYSKTKVKKVKHKAEKPYKRKTRKVKSKDVDLARARRSSLHF